MENDKLKISLVSTFYPPSYGGVEKQVENISQKLSEAGHSVTVYTTDALHKINEPRVFGFQTVRKISETLTVKRFRYGLKFASFFRFSFKLVLSVVSDDSKIIHIHNIHDAHLVPIIIFNLYKRKKLVVTGHNPFAAIKDGKSLLYKFAIWFNEFVISIFSFFIFHFSFFDLTYIAILETEKEYVRKHFHFKKVTYIPNGIDDIFYNDEYSDLELRKYTQKKYDFVVGTASRLNYVKGLQNLKVAVDNLPNVLFVFAGGDDGYQKELQSIFKNDENVVFTKEYLKPLDLKKLYKLIDIFLLPSLYEPFGLTLVEAMTQGKFILASDTDGPKEILNPLISEIIPAEDQDKWFKKIKFYLENPKVLEMAKPKAIEISQKYRWENTIPKIIDVYK